MEEVKQKNKSKLASKIISRVLLALICFICAAIIFFNLSHSYFKVYGASMSPTLNEGVVSSEECKDGVFVSKIKSYGRGDIVVVKKQDNDYEKFVIKRIIALGGDRIKIEEIDGVCRIILIKDKKTEQEILCENYLTDYSINNCLLTKFNDFVKNGDCAVDKDGFLVVERDYVFYLGDNRNNSKDCLNYGPVKKDCVVGKVDYIVYGDKNMYGQVIGQFFGWQK